MTTPSKTPWLTVVMPIHGGEAWIDTTLASLAAEADEGIEILAIDSSPNAATCDLVQRYADRLSLRIVVRPDLPSWPAKTNFGVDIARATHVCWLHQDDLWLPGRAAAVRRWIAEAPDAVLHLSSSAIVDGRGRVQGLWRCPFAIDGGLDAGTLLERLLVQNFVAAPAPVYCVLADVLHHVPLGIRTELLAAICGLMAPNAKFVMKEWERSYSPIYWLCYLSDRWITGDRIRYLTQGEAHRQIDAVFGTAARIDETRIAPWRNNFTTLVTG